MDTILQSTSSMVNKTRNRKDQYFVRKNSYKICTVDAIDWYELIFIGKIL